MKRVVFLCLILLVIGCASVFAQRGSGAGGRGGGGNPSAGNGGGGQARPDRNTPPRNDQSASGERQNRPQNGERPAGVNRALRGLDLTDAQKQQIHDIEKNARENGTDRQTVAQQIKAVLTPEQVEKLEKRKEKQKERREKRQNQNSGDQPTNN